MDPTPNDGLTEAAPRLDDPRAEEVRAHLALLRGGAPFLSAVDGRLLVRWLEGGVPVVLILSALDRAAEKRQRAARPARGRLGLGAVRAAVDKAVGAAAAPAPAVAVSEAWAAWCAAVQAAPVAPADAPAHAALCAALAAVSPGAGPEERLHAALTAVRAFHVAAAAADPARHAQLRDAAAVALGALEGALDAAAFTELVEEAAGAALRGLYPSFSTAALRESLLGGAG